MDTELNPNTACQLVFERKEASPIRIAQGNESKFSRRIDDQVLSHAGDMGHCQGGPHQEFYNEVTISNSIQAVFCNRLEAKFFGKEFTVYDKGVSCKRTTTKREDGYSGD